MKIEWTDIAELLLSENIEYLEDEWSYQVLLDFESTLENVQSLLREHPFIGRELNKKYRIILVVNSISLIYKIDGNIILIVAVWNNYRNPSDLADFIS